MKKGWDKYADQKRIAAKGYIRKLRTLNPIPKEINEPNINIETADRDERSGNDGGSVPSIVDVPIVPTKPARRRRKDDSDIRDVSRSQDKKRTRASPKNGMQA
jgi:hypothetical protein